MANLYALGVGEVDTDFQRVLIDRETLQRRIAEMGAQISHDYQGKTIVLVGILKGAVMFLADLARQITVPSEFDFMAVSSYGQSSVSTGVVRIIKDLDHTIEGKDVLVVEDIIDTGLTLAYLREVLLARRPNSLRVCCLLDKPGRRKVAVPVDYRGFEIPDEFVVGYGLDYREMYRNLGEIYVLSPHVYKT